MKGSRNVRWDNYKAFLGLLMVYAHTFRVINGSFPKMGGLIVFIYLFHMPAFLFVSGMFSKKAVEQRDMRRVLSLMMQYLLVKFALYFGDVLIKGKMFYRSLLTEGSVAWFALSAMECLLLAMLFRKTKPRYVFFVGIVMGCLIGYCSDIGTFLSLSRTVVYFPYFWIGYVLEIEKLENAADKKWVKAGSAVFILAVFGFVISRSEKLSPYFQFIKAKACYSEYSDILPHTSLGGMYRLILYAVGFALVLAWFFVIPKRRIPLISGIGSRTLSLYAFHYLVVTYITEKGQVKEFVLTHFDSTWQVAVFYLLVAVGICILCTLPPLEKLVRMATAVPKWEKIPEDTKTIDES